MKDWIGIITIFLLIALFIFGVAEYEIWRWHTFQEITHSNISYLQWTLLHGGR